MNIAHTLHDTHKNINLETVTKFYKKYKQLHFKYIHIYLNIFFDNYIYFCQIFWIFFNFFLMSGVTPPNVLQYH